MMDVVEEVSQGCIIQLSRGNTQWEKHALGFVDDKRHYVICLKTQTQKQYLQQLKYRSVRGMNFFTL